MCSMRQNSDDPFVFDFAPMCGPIVMTPELKKAMQAGLEQRQPIGHIIRSMMNARLAAFTGGGFRKSSEAEVWRRSGVKAIQVTLGGLEIDPSGWDGYIRDLAWYLRAEQCGDFLRLCRTADELEAAASDSVLGVLLGTQDAAWADRKFDRIDTLYRAGVRVVQLTYNQRNLIGDGCSEPANAGLSRFGTAFVKHLGQLGVIVDVSHSGERTSLDAIDVATRPTAVTHAACRALHDHPRAKSDDVLHAIRDADGFFGVVAIPHFLTDDPHASVDHIIRHVDHAANTVGIERVGIATDWGGVTPDMPPQMQQGAKDAFVAAGFALHEVPPLGEALTEFDAYEKWPSITAALRGRFSPEETAGLIGGNWLSFTRRTLEASH